MLGIAMERADRMQMLTERARVRVNLGHVCDLLGDYTRGRELLEEAFALSMLLSNYAAQMGSLFDLTRIDLSEHKPEQAAATLVRVQPLVDEVGRRIRKSLRAD